ncbi:hypothetical protein TPHA_0A02260 [Tetrapisispora phaffii CBS 4417]|uniref:1-phosphatidylinositol-3-phosphate 5-kinase n=1 Tax=Tetrapisispora phaffii (strain ATCC 24235 / CBS 4417 / NBRC 1672 / NRRL Y-8282 / UCD 70-5) TaxID=1071381 RepID=G8BN30_TETPH|nr:hypothetical protein TPHA_0A02260 [Tetrapisispora phaffii CBS 4417]CCE61308.1 hypothetical protein TPHA_0A02260 [Tetrapisispora phaffii CBS 4417]
MSDNGGVIKREEIQKIQTNIRNNSIALKPENLEEDFVVSSYKPEILPTNVLLPKTTTDIVTSNVLSNDITLPISKKIEEIDDNINSTDNNDNLIHAIYEDKDKYNANRKTKELNLNNAEINLIKEPVGAHSDKSNYLHENMRVVATDQSSNNIDTDLTLNVNLQDQNFSAINRAGKLDDDTSLTINNINSNSNSKQSFLHQEYKPSKSLTFTLNNEANMKRSSIYESKSKVKAIPIRNSNTNKFMENLNDDNMSVNSTDSSLNASLSKSFLFGFYNTYKRDPKKTQERILLKEYWMKDENARECFICGKSFNTFRRKHHCRMCGQIFCRNCIAPVQGEKIGYDGNIKVCLSCNRHIDAYEDSSEGEQEEDTTDLNMDGMASSYENTPEASYDVIKNGNDPTAYNADHDDIQSILTNGEDSKLFLSTPTPPPKMTIPATRQGESLEIFSDTGYPNSYNKHSNNMNDNRLSYNNGVSSQKDRYTIRDVDILPDQYDKLSSHLNKIKRKNTTSSLKSSFLNYVSGGKSPQDKISYQSSKASDIFKQAGKKQYQFEFNYGLDPEVNKLNASRNSLHEKSSMKSSQNRNFDISKSGSSSEDEGSMSIYSTLIDPKHTHNPIRSVRSSTKSSQRAAASLRRIQFRRKSKTKRSTSTSVNSAYKGLNLIAHSTPNLISVIDDDECAYANGEYNMLSSSGVSNANNFQMKSKNSTNSYAMRRSVSSFNDRKLKRNKVELNEVSNLHLEALLKQVMLDQELTKDTKWSNIMEIFLKQLQVVEINGKEANSLDYRQNYIKIKRIPGDIVESSEYINGIVFGKSLSSKRMPRYFSNPRILLIMFPLEYTKNENHFLSLETVLAQEREYLNKLISRISSFNADIIFVGANASGYALDLLDKSGVIVQYNLKPQVIERIAKLTEADIAVSIDKLSTNIKMGECESFEVKTFIYGNISKSYTFLRGCNPALGGTILLRGGDEEILSKLKQVTEFMVYIYFALKLENCLFKDNFIQPSLEFYNTTRKQNLENDEKGYFSEFLNEYNRRILSVSPTVKFPLPFLLRRGRELEKALTCKKQELLKLSGEMNVDDIKGILPSDIESKLTNSDLRYLSKFVHEKEIENLELEFQRRSRQWELSYSQSHNIMSTGTHQSITVLYSMVSTKLSTPCIGPQILNIDYFWDNDISLGQYIENIVATSSYHCQQGCNGLLLDHYRSYVHGSGKVDVLIEKLQSKLPRLNDIILTWSYCKKCGTSTPIIQMAQHTWSYSFGKFLEVMFWSDKEAVKQVSKCPHDFTKDHVKYYGYNDLVVRMEYSDLEVFELVTPPRKIIWKSDKDIKLKIELFYNILDKINLFYGSIRNRLLNIKLDIIPKELYVRAASILKDFQKLVDTEEAYILDLIENLYKNVPGDVHLPLNQAIQILSEKSENWQLLFDNFAVEYMPSENDISQITTNQLKKFFSPNYEELPDNLNEKANEHEVINDNASLENSLKSITDSHHSKNHNTVPESEIKDDNRPNVAQEPDLVNPRYDNEIIGIEGRNFNNNFTKNTLGTKAGASVNISMPNLFDKVSLSRKSFSDVEKPDLRRLSLMTNEDITKYYEQNRHVNTKVGKLANFFDKMHIDSLSKEFELQRELERLSINKAKYQSYRLTNHTPIVDIYKDVKDAVEEPLHDKPLSMNDNATSKTIFNNTYQNNLNTNLEHELENSIHIWGEKMRKMNDNTDNQDDNKHSKRECEPNDKNHANENAVNDRNSEDLSSEKRNDNESTIQEKLHTLDKSLQEVFDTKVTDNPNAQGSTLRERSSLLKALSNFWADHSASSWKPFQYPTTPTEHVFSDSNVIIREDEPSSLIAFCLSIEDYKQKMLHLQKSEAERHDTVTQADIDHADTTSNNETLMKGGNTESTSMEPHEFNQHDSIENMSHMNINDSGEALLENNEALENIMLKKKAVHLRYQFQDQDSVMSCKIFFAEHFEAFRETCCDRDKFIQSLSRCIKWNSNGGKSGSGFLKTLDDRFVIKELSHSELDAFIKFAPNYFEYMSQAMFHDLPTSLAKIFGFFQIQVKNSSTSKNYKMDLIIMENLFYERKSTRIFDLKGSMRNRHVEQTGKENEVLLDENMIEYIYESPIHVGEYDKKLLRASLWNDTLFLAKMNVMDYSLVIGIDNETHTITAGIIDFIRTFTWDKKLESWVKEKGFVGGGASSTKMPTVVTPRQYKNRFREAMECYILMVPDPWFQDSI